MAVKSCPQCRNDLALDDWRCRTCGATYNIAQTPPAKLLAILVVASLVFEALRLFVF